MFKYWQESLLEGIRQNIAESLKSTQLLPLQSSLSENFITTIHILRGPWPLSPTFHQRRRCPLSSVLYENRTVRYRLTNQANDATPLNWCSSTSHAQFPPRKVVDLIKLRSQGNQAARQPPAICLSACLYACLPTVRQRNTMLGNVSCRIFNGIIKNDMSIFHRMFALYFL